MNRTKHIGRLGEDIACTFLMSQGFTIIERNYLRPWGEIDVIAEKDGVVRFVEVKAVSRENLEGLSREINDYRPEEQVHPNKLKKIRRTAELYMNDRKDAPEFQLDVVAVYLDVARRKARCRLYEQVL